MSEKEERIKEEEDQESENREERRSKPDVNVEEEKDRIKKKVVGESAMLFNCESLRLTKLIQKEIRENSVWLRTSEEE